MGEISVIIPRVPFGSVPPLSLEEQVEQARMASRWFLSKIDLDHLQKSRNANHANLPAGEWEAMWEAEWDKRTLLRSVGAGPGTTTASELLRPYASGSPANT